MDHPRNDFVTFDAGHQDLVRAVAYNLHSNRRVTASADHRLKVHDLQASTSTWKLTDTWRAHDAEVLDAKWLPPHLGPVLASIGNDSKFKLWHEDPLVPPCSGHRFKCIFTLHPPTPSHSPFTSFDFKSLSYTNTYLALLTSDGMLSVHETLDPESLASWGLIAEFPVCEDRPLRGEEVGFRVQFDPNPSPCWTAVREGLGARSLGLVTAGMDQVRVWRTSRLRTWYQAASLGPHGALVRDVAWGGGGARGYDLIATACKDGGLRIFEVGTAPGGPPDPPTPSDPPQLTDSPTTTAVRTPQSQPAQHSAITAGLSNLPPHFPHQASQTSQTSHTSHANGAADPSEVQHTVRLATHIPDAHHGAVWSLKWSPISIDGISLFSAGDDGKIRVWKRTVGGDWAEYAVVEGGAAQSLSDKSRGAALSS